MVAGLILGLERESHGRAAGLKTTILACVASCLAMILSENFYREAALSMLHPCPGRSERLHYHSVACQQSHKIAQAG